MVIVVMVLFVLIVVAVYLGVAYMMHGIGIKGSKMHYYAFITIVAIIQGNTSHLSSAMRMNKTAGNRHRNPLIVAVQFIYESIVIFPIQIAVAVDVVYEKRLESQRKLAPSKAEAKEIGRRINTQIEETLQTCCA